MSHSFSKVLKLSILRLKIAYVDELIISILHCKYRHSFDKIKIKLFFLKQVVKLLVFNKISLNITMRYIVEIALALSGTGFLLSAISTFSSSWRVAEAQGESLQVGHFSACGDKLGCQHLGNLLIKKKFT